MIRHLLKTFSGLENNNSDKTIIRREIGYQIYAGIT